MAFALSTIQNVSHLICLCHFFSAAMQNAATIVLGKLISSVRRVIVNDRAIKFNTSFIWFMGTTRRQILFTSFLRCTTSNAQSSVWVKVEVFSVCACVCVCSQCWIPIASSKFFERRRHFWQIYVFVRGCWEKTKREKSTAKEKWAGKTTAKFLPATLFFAHVCGPERERERARGRGSWSCATRCYCCCLCAYDLLHGNACAVRAHGLLLPLPLPLLLRGILLQQNANLSISSKVRQAFFPAVAVAGAGTGAVAVARLSLDVVCCWHLPAKTTAETCSSPCPCPVSVCPCLAFCVRGWQKLQPKTNHTLLLRANCQCADKKLCTKRHKLCCSIFFSPLLLCPALFIFVCLPSFPHSSAFACATFA